MTDGHRPDHGNTEHLWPGVPLALGSAALFGATAPLSKLLLATANPWLLAGILYLAAGVGLAVLSAVRSGVGLGRTEAPLHPRDVPWLAAVVLLGGVIGPLLLMFGLARTTASAGSLLLNVEGLATMAIAWVVFQENVDRRLLVGAFAILAGAVLTSWNGTGIELDGGALMIVGACVAWGIDNNLTRKLSAADPVQIATAKGLVAGVVNIALALATGATFPGAATIVASATVGLFGIGISLVLYMLALRHLGTARTGAYYSLAPFIGAVLAIILIGEPVTVALVLAASLMSVGLWLHLTERHEHDHAHRAVEHEHRHVHDIHHQHAHDGPVTEPHTHWHRHEPLTHSHPHYPDIHHRHSH